jgi:hypothetical protein
MLTRTGIGADQIIGYGLCQANRMTAMRISISSVGGNSKSAGCSLALARQFRPAPWYAVGAKG